VTVYRRGPEVLWRNSADRVVLLPPKAANPISVDGPGQALWILLEEPQSADALEISLARQYAVDRAVVSEALVPLLDELVEAGAIEPVGAAS
jgi:coenzyme PQQ synthesis protein D (PqqD)